MRALRFPCKATALAAVIALGGMAFSGAAQAQNLKQLYEAARDYDATYLAARAQAQSAEYRAAKSGALALPSASATATANTGWQDYSRTVFGPRSGDSNSVGATLRGTYPLFNRGNSITIAQAAKALTAALTDLETAEQDLIVRVAQAYFDVLNARDTLGTALASKKAITEQLASAKRNFEVGTATITDTREAQARFDLATAQELAADNDLRVKSIALDQLVGRVGLSPKTLAGAPTLPALMPADPDVWARAADNQHPLVRKARAALEVAELESAKARAGELPTVDLVASVGSQRGSGSSAGTPGLISNATVGVQLNYPLYTGGLTQNTIKEAVALEDKSRNDLEAARRGVAQGTRVAFFGVQSLQGQVKALEAAESSTKLALEATQLGYKVGVRVNLDVLNAQTQLFQTQRDLAKARYDALMGSLKLRQAAGQLNPNDLEPVNRLLAP